MLAVAENEVEPVAAARRNHTVEKLGVQLAAVTGLAAAYWVFWPLVRPEDPVGPLALLRLGALDRLVAFAVGMLVLAVACGAVTIHARPEGAVLVLAAAGSGLSLHSQPIRALLWLRDDSLGGLFWQLLGEMALLAMVMGAAVAMLGVVRGAVGRRLRRWRWRDTAAQGSHDEGGAAGRAGGSLRGFADWLVGTAADGAARTPAARREQSLRRWLGVLTDAAVSAAIILLLMQSSDRGQVLFAVFAGCALGAMIVQMPFPGRCPLGAVVAPLLVGAAFYAVAAAGATPDGPQAWMAVPHYAKALPIDWVTVAPAGSLLGHWTVMRMRESKVIDAREEQARGKDEQRQAAR